MATQKRSEQDSRDNFQIIIDALHQYPGGQKSSANSRFLCCAFHDDNTPSMSVFLGTDGPIPLGFWHCFGCGEKGHWNVLAKKAGLDKIQEWKTNVHPSENLITKEIEDKLLGSDTLTFKSVLRVMRCEEAMRWPSHLDWRGFDGSLIHAVGGHIINDEYNDDIALLFPIKINGRVRGAVKAIRERKSKKQLAYVTMKGDWVKDYGLFPYMYTQRILRKQRYDFVVLVEGPRDALRLVAHGVPALAVLGATSMSTVKTLLISSLDVSTVYVMPDNDEGGDVMWATARKFLKRANTSTVKRLKLPKVYDDAGKLVKMDPGNCPEDVLDNLLRLFKANHGFEYIS